eukprot:TRINITY_DN3105_c1_g1_i6.p2 TRINITY_DN3105_c1_g1~~TRINITY_DN3105_c1_g1_i6.p2  ORF type:complete len:122 (-),score=6.49 TRINITY_DN3105_c1_g1_i6:100-465(-)
MLLSWLIREPRVEDAPALALLEKGSESVLTLEDTSFFGGSIAMEGAFCKWLALEVVVCLGSQEVLSFGAMTLRDAFCGAALSPPSTAYGLSFPPLPAILFVLAISFCTTLSSKNKFLGPVS